MKEYDIEVMKKYAKDVVTPVMVEYTKWVIYESERRGLKRLYFLARDGYLLHLIAKEICKKNGLDIDIRYLYCSRYSLRMPTFKLIGAEKYEILFYKSYRCTPNTVLKRAGLNDDQCQEILADFGVDKDKILYDKQFENFKNYLIENKKFNTIIEQNSLIAYDNIIAYFKQEGLFDKDLAIVDSGWTGSMQRSIRQLVESVGYKKNIIGFYFGMFKSPKLEDGEYLTYYFSAKKANRRKMHFNNNLFEIMLSANHGMTLGYQKVEGKMSPILQQIKDDNMSILIQTQIDSVLDCINNNTNMLIIENFELKKSIKKIFNILKRAMIYPTIEEVDMLSNIYFCDDITGEYQIPLVDKNTINVLKQNMVMPIIFRKIFRRGSILEKVYWPYGVIAYQPKILRLWYRFNIKFIYFLRYTFFS